MVISDIEDKVFLNKNDRTAADYIRLLDFIDDERTIDIWKRIVRNYASSDNGNITWNFQGSPRLLAKYDRSDVIPTLEVLMTSSNKDVRKDVANAFSISKDQRALPLLMKMRNDPYDSIRLTVAHRIRTIDTDETTQILTEMLRDSDDWVREAAERALAERDKMPKDVPLIPFSELSCAIRQTRAVSTMQGKDTPPKNDSGESNLFSSHNCEKALNAFTEELKMRRTTKDPFGEAWVLVQIGDIYTKGKRYELAYEYYLSALELFQQMGNDAEISLLDDIVGLSLELGRLNDALSYLNRLLVLSSSNKKESIRSDQGRVLGRIAAVYNQLDDQSKRIEFLKRSISFNTPNGNKWELAATLETLGSAYEKTGKNTEALASYRKALDVRLELAKEYDPNKFLGGNDDISRLRATIARLEE
jgi:tetratricopeptide (TPR) repeat protein